MGLYITILIHRANLGLNWYQYKCSVKQEKINEQKINKEKENKE
jgi:hypothetical protein